MWKWNYRSSKLLNCLSCFFASRLKHQNHHKRKCLQKVFAKPMNERIFAFIITIIEMKRRSRNWMKIKIFAWCADGGVSKVRLKIDKNTSTKWKSCDKMYKYGAANLFSLILQVQNGSALRVVQWRRSIQHAHEEAERNESSHSLKSQSPSHFPGKWMDKHKILWIEKLNCMWQSHRTALKYTDRLKRRSNFRSQNWLILYLSYLNPFTPGQNSYKGVKNWPKFTKKWKKKCPLPFTFFLRLLKNSTEKYWSSGVFNFNF